VGGADRGDPRLAEKSQSTETQLNHAKWHASTTVDNSNKTQKIRPPAGSALVRDFLSTASAPATVDEIVNHLIASGKLDYSQSNLYMAKRRVQRSLNHLRDTGAAIFVPVPGWRKYHWVLKEREQEFWRDSRAKVAGNFTDTKKVLEVLSKVPRPISVAEIVDQVAIALGERPRTKRARDLGVRIRACLHFHREQGTVLQVVFERTKKQLWLLRSRKDELLPSAMIKPDGKIVNNANVLSIIASSTTPISAPEIAKVVVSVTGEMPTERNVKRATDFVRQQLRKFRSENLVHEVPIPNSRFKGWILGAEIEDTSIDAEPMPLAMPVSFEEPALL
jgi:hypothetical protein